MVMITGVAGYRWEIINGIAVVNSYCYSDFSDVAAEQGRG